MKSTLLVVVSYLLFMAQAQGQATNIISTNPLAEQVMLGSYDPASFAASTILNDPDTISKGINTGVSPDSLHSYLVALSSFQNRNTGSDTVSSTKGIGAARRWVYSKFEQISAANENRLIPSYLQFDKAICSANQHRNIFAVLPGMDTSDKSIVLIEAHIDSRCADLCDTACLAEGMEDNGSGSALVIELARVMSKYSYNHTLVFVLTIAEEQGLDGAEAFADYVQQKNIAVKSVFNNDVVGGVICGETSSPPSCPGVGLIDSTNLRLFSFSSYNSMHKQLARYVKLQYKEMVLPVATVPMSINIMTPEDRTGRGGDHIPFRAHGYRSIRFTSANEHGNADVTAANYADRQHTSGDVLGKDVNLDGIIDSFYVDFNYLARNAVINGNAMGMIAISPKTPDFTLSQSGSDLTVQITQEQQYLYYRIGLRTLTNDWDSLYTFTGSTTHTLTLPDDNYKVSVASVDNKNIESLFSKELTSNISLVNDIEQPAAPIELLQNKPNPFDEATMIGVLVNELPVYREAYLSIRDIASGKEVRRMPIKLETGMNEVMYSHGYHATGIFVYSLIIDGKTIASKKMVFAN